MGTSFFGGDFFGGGFFAGVAPIVAAVITGTAVASITEADIVAGGKTIIITLTGDTWVAAGAVFNAQRQAIIDGLDSGQSEAHGWNVEVRDKEVVTAVVRTSDTVVTITLGAAADYEITSMEIITVTVPGAALVGTAPLVGTPTFNVLVQGMGGLGSGGLSSGLGLSGGISISPSLGISL